MRNAEQNIQNMSNQEILISHFADQDIPALSRVHLSAYRGYMNAGIGVGYVKQFLRWFLSHPGAIALKAEIDGEPCGYVVGMEQGDHAQLNHDLLLFAALGVMTHPWVLLQRRYRASALAKIKRIMNFRRNRNRAADLNRAHTQSAAHGRVAGLVSVAVGPQFSGKGIGVAVVNAFAQRAKELGYDTAQLSVLNENDRARSVYAKAGWDLTGSDGRAVYYTKRLAAES